MTENRSFVNIKEREGFLIEPFTASIATAAVAYTMNRDDYVFDAAYDVNRNAAFLSAGKRFDEKTAAKVCMVLTCCFCLKDVSRIAHVLSLFLHARCERLLHMSEFCRVRTHFGASAGTLAPLPVELSYFGSIPVVLALAPTLLSRLLRGVCLLSLKL